MHAATAILLFLVLWRMTGDLWPSAFVAAVFAIHPLRVESVAWVAERKDVLSGLFFMLTLGAYVGYVRRPFSLVRYLTVVVLFALGLMAKPMLVTLPFVLLLLDYWPLGRMRPPAMKVAANHEASGHRGGWWSRSSRCWCCRPLPVWQHRWPRGRPSNRSRSSPLASRIANALVSYVAYLGQFFCPVGLAAFYPHPGSGLPTWKVAGALLLLACICVGLLVWRRQVPVSVGRLVLVPGDARAGDRSGAGGRAVDGRPVHVLAPDWSGDCPGVGSEASVRQMGLPVPGGAASLLRW